MPKPNILARGLRYVADAFKYATIPFINPLLRKILLDYTHVAGGSVGEEGDVAFYLRLAATNPAVFSAVTTIADRVTDTSLFEIKHRQGNEWTKVDDHPLPALLRRPNSLMSGSLLLSDCAWWYELLGNAYWFVVTDSPGRGPIREIWPLPADRVRPDPQTLRISPITGKPILDYNYQLGSIITLPGENVVHFRTANPFDPWRGLSKLSPLQANMRMDFAQLEWLGSYYGKGNAVPASIVSVPPTLSDPDFEAVVQDIQEQFGGKRQTAITRAGDIKVEVIQHSIADMQVVQHREKNAEEVRRVFKVPEGLNSAVSGQSRLAAETALARDAIQPLLNYMAETMTLVLLPFYGETGDIKVEAKSVIPQDIAMEIAAYKAYAPDRPLNENRKKQELPPIRLTGKLAEFQQLLDEVPQGLLPVLSPILMPKAPAPGLGGPAAAPPGIAPAHAQLFGAMTGGAPPPDQGGWSIAQPARLPGPSGADETPGARLTGLPVALDPVQQMIGKSAFTPGERDAALYKILNQYVKQADAEPQPLLTALLYTLQNGEQVNAS